MDLSLLPAFKTLLHNAVGLLTIFNPLAAAAIMIASSPSGLSKADMRSISRKASLTLLVGSLLTILLGNAVFRFFGISTGSIMVIGGIVLLIMSLSMIQGKISETKHSSEEADAAREKEDISVIPLGIPVLFGPGAISTLMVFHAADTSITGLLLLSGAIVAAVGTVYIVLFNADRLTHALGVHGMKIMTRVMGLIVGAIAVQFMVRGVKLLWNTL